MPELLRRRSIPLAFALLVSTALGPAARATSWVESSTGLGVPPLETGRTELEMADINGDGNVDLVSVGDHGSPGGSTQEHGIMVWLGNGHGGWGLVQFGEFGYGGIAVGDVNGDGFADVGFGIHHNNLPPNLGDKILGVALGDGSAQSWTAWDQGLATGGETWGMFGSDFADVDGDGRLDLGSISFGCCNGVRVYLNHGDGTWAPAFAVPDGNSYDEFVFGDVNGDGWPDFAASHDAATVYVGDGNGGFAVADSNLLPAQAYDRSGVALGDVNGDGRDDLAWIDLSGGPHVWAHNADGTWTNVGGSLPATGPWGAAQLWDMDGDGIVDLAAFGDGKIQVWKGNGAGSWTAMASWSTPNPGRYAAFRVGGDGDHNGLPDVVLVSEEGSFFNTVNKVHFYRESSTPTALAVRVVHPGAAARLRTGTVRFIDWAASVPSGGPGTATIEYSRTGTAGPWYPVASGVPNNGRYQWLVPDAQGTDDLRLRVTVTAGTSSASGTSGAAMHLAPGHDGVALSWSDRSTLTWTDRMGRASYRGYRGDWNRLLATGEYTQDPAVVPAAARFCSIAGRSLADPFLPAPGALAFYLVTGTTAAVEGSLGVRSDGTERGNAHPCP